MGLFDILKSNKKVDDISVGECLDMFIAFYRKGRVDISGWEDLS